LSQVNSGLVTELPAAILWDMDGTLVDTEPYWFRAETELVHAAGGTWTSDDGLALVGAGLWHSAQVFQGRGVDLPEDEIVKRLTDRVLEQVEVAVPWRAGVLDLLGDLHRSGVRMAMVTMSVRRMAEYVAASLPFPAFDIIVPGDEVTHSKPHPEPYLRAAELLGVAPEACVAIEDSAPGLASAGAAGAVCVGVPLHVPLQPGAGYVLWDSIEGRTAEDIVTVFKTAAASTTATPRSVA
jgi:HAD superfamily hydrolase (TIGR01509 family)